MYSVTQSISQTITSANLPIAGSLWIEYIDTAAANISVSAAGAGQTWNYASSFTVSDTTGVNFEPVSNAPAYMNLNTLFPNADAVVLDIPADSNATPIQMNADGLYIDGVYDQGLINNPQVGLNLNHIDFNPNRLMIPTPFSLNSTRNNVAKFQITATVPNVTTVTSKNSFVQNFVADATGTLTTPLGNFSNVIRIKQFTYSVDSTSYNPPVSPNEVSYSDSTITYSFVRAGANCLLMTIYLDALNMQIISASYYDPLTNSGITENDEIKVTMYPNPATDLFYLNHVRDNSTISITDITGKAFSSKFLGGYNSTIMINTNDMPAGLYMVTLNSPKDGNYYVSKFQVVK